jgi:hypothetical protein
MLGKMKQSPRPWLPADDDMLRSLAMLGLSEGEIAAKVDRNKSSVRSRAAKIKIAIARDLNGIQKLSFKRVCGDTTGA